MYRRMKLNQENRAIKYGGGGEERQGADVVLRILSYIENLLIVAFLAFGLGVKKRSRQKM